METMMMETSYFLFKASIHPISGDDVVDCVNPDGQAFDKAALKDAAQRLYAAEASSAGVDEGVLIQRVDQFFRGVSIDRISALSYEELAAKFQFQRKTNEGRTKSPSGTETQIGKFTS